MNELNLEIEERLFELLEKEAIRQKTSIADVITAMLQEKFAAQLNVSPASQIHRDLDFLSGTWQRAEYEQFIKNIESFNQIDKSIWK